MFNQEEKAVLLRLIRLFYKFKFHIFIICIFLLIVTVIFLFRPILCKWLIDDGILGKNYYNVVLFVSILIAIQIFSSIIDVFKEKIRASISADIHRTLFAAVFKGLSNIKISYFETKNSTEIFKDIDVDIKKMLIICDNSVFFIITQLLSFVGGVIGLFIIDYKLTMLVLLFIPVKFFIIFFLSKKRKEYIVNFLEVSNKLAHWMGDNLTGMRDIRLLGVINKKEIESDNHVNAVAQSEKKLSIIDAININASSSLIFLLESLLYLAGAKLVFSGSLSLGSLFAFITYSIHVLNPISAVLNIGFLLTGVVPSAKRYFSLIDYSEENKESSGNIAIDSIDSIEFNNVRFKYADKDVFSNVFFKIENGQKVAIVGPNGSGKTTIFNMVERFIVPSEGVIRVNGKDINSYDISAFRNAIACVNQKNHLFNTSIMNNITMYRDADEKALEGAIASTSLSAVLEDCPGAVGVAGCNLSGGQSQKVALARALFRNTHVYLFDEASSNMDSAAKESIMQALGGILKDKTVLMIVHDFAFIPYMDKIIAIEPGGAVREYAPTDDFARGLLSGKA